MRPFHAFAAAQAPAIDAYLQRSAQGIDPLVAPVVEHVLLAGGKRLRPLLTLLAGGVLEAEGHGLLPLACAQEMIHAATLLHDDILDNALSRRGQAAAHTVFGVTRTVLAGDLLLALANRIVAGYGLTRLTDCLSEAIMRTVEGEIAEMGHARNASMEVDAYLGVVTGKTAHLFKAACQAGVMAAGADQRLETAAAEFGLNLGVAFQLVDDALDYAASPQDLGKPVGRDLRDGKITLPLILLLDSMDQDGRAHLEERIRQGGLDDGEAEAVVRCVREAGLDQQARQWAEPYLDRAGRCLEEFPDSPAVPLLQEALAFIRHRNR